ncbi:MAG: MalY/PatB family protein [Ardenticatenaceae bacterium]|nr:MalY/PatB family protein [Ardenticatenaceae bacterium]
MSLDLNKIHPRHGTNSVKWEFIWRDEILEQGDHAHPSQGDQQILPMWVADMDFRCPEPVIEALHERVSHGLFGYSAPTDEYFSTIIDWTSSRYGWEIEKEWIKLTPGVVPAVHMLLQAFTSPGDKVLIQRPVYYPFSSAIENNGCEIVSNTLIYENGSYRMDFDDLAEKTADPAVKVAILCSPHNPVSRVWTYDELKQFGEICLANNVLVISDEIHCDLIFSGHQFVSFPTISEEFAQKSITCFAPSKTFNLAGLKNSNIIIPDPEIREKFEEVLFRNGLWGTNSFGIVATIAAYREGVPWLNEVMAYIEANYRFMKEYLAEHIPEIKLVEPEGTYLIWADCRELGLSPAERKKLILDVAGVYLDEGEMFGPEGEDFERFNIACPRPILEMALNRLKEAVRNYVPA